MEPELGSHLPLHVPEINIRASGWLGSTKTPKIPSPQDFLGPNYPSSQSEGSHHSWLMTAFQGSPPPHCPKSGWALEEGRGAWFGDCSWSAGEHPLGTPFFPMWMSCFSSALALHFLLLLVSCQVSCNLSGQHPPQHLAPGAFPGASSCSATAS